MGEKLIVMWSHDRCSAKRQKRPPFSVGSGFGSGLGLGYDYDPGDWIGLGLVSGFGSEIGAQRLQN